MVLMCVTCYNPNDPDYILKYTKPARYHLWLRHLASPEHQEKFLEKYSRGLEKYTFLHEASYVIAGIPSYIKRSDTFMYEVAVWASGFGVITEFAYFPKEECFLVTLQGAGLGPYGPAIERAESIAKERRLKNFSIRVFRKHLMTKNDWYLITRGTLAEVLRTETCESGFNQESGTQQKTTMQRMPRDSKPETSVDNKENFNNHSVTSTSKNDVVDAHANKIHGREKSNKHAMNTKESKILTTNVETTQEPQQSQQVDAAVPNEVKFHRDKYDSQGDRNIRGRGRKSRVVIPPSAYRNQHEYVVNGKSREPGNSSAQGQEKEPKDKIEPFAENQSLISDALEREKDKIEIVESCELTTAPNYLELSTKAEEITSLAKVKIEPLAGIPSEQRVDIGSEETVAISELKGFEATTDPATLPQNQLKLSVEDPTKESTFVVAKNHPIEPAAQNPIQQRDAKETIKGKIVAVKRSEDASHQVTSALNLCIEVSVDPVAENTSVTTTKETREVVDIQPLCIADVPAKEEEEPHHPAEECFLVTLRGAASGPRGPLVDRAESIAQERRFEDLSIRVFRKHWMTNDDWYSIVGGTLAGVLHAETREFGFNQKYDAQIEMTMQRMPRDSKPITSVDNKDNFNNHLVTPTSANDVVDAHVKNTKESKTLTTNVTKTQQSQQVDAGVPNEVKFHCGKYDGQGDRNIRGRGRKSRVVIPPSAYRNQPEYAVNGKSREPGNSSAQGQEKEPKDKIEPFAENQSQIRDALESEKDKIEIAEVESCEATTAPNHLELSAKSTAEDSTSTAKGKIEPLAGIPSEQRVATGSEEVSVDPVAESTHVTHPVSEAEVPAKEEEPDYMQYALYWYRF